MAIYGLTGGEIPDHGNEEGAPTSRPIDSREQTTDLREIKSQLNQIIEAVRSTVPESMGPDILAKLPGGDKAPESVDEDDDDEAFDPVVDGYDPLDFAEDDGF